MTRLLLLPLTLLSLAGCAEGPVKPDPAVVADLRSKYVLEVEPADPVTPLDWRDLQAGDGPVDVLATVEGAAPAADSPEVDSDRVVLVGQVGGMPNPWGLEEGEPEFPWRKGQAAFFLVDPATAAEFETHAEEEGGDHSDCPFCSREAANQTQAVAVITFNADDGEPIDIDSRDLFELAEGELVVVKGVASLVGDLLLVDADGLFVRK